MCPAPWGKAVSFEVTCIKGSVRRKAKAKLENCPTCLNAALYKKQNKCTVINKRFHDRKGGLINSRTSGQRPQTDLTVVLPMVYRGQLRPPNVYRGLEVCNWLGTVEIKIRERLCPEDKLLFIVINLALLRNV